MSAYENMFKFINCHDLPWVHLIWKSYYTQGFNPKRPTGSFWWRNILKLANDFKEDHQCKIGTGNTIMIWKDDWGDGILKDLLPELYSFVINPEHTYERFIN